MKTGNWFPTMTNMNREIKFRAWSKAYKGSKAEMFRVFMLTYVEGKGLIASGRGGSAPIDKDTILMQFTGLKDKNGKEIYEGDVVYAEEYVGFKKLKAEVIFNRGCFCLNTGTIPEALIPELTEVIGNIFQNPELLK